MERTSKKAPKRPRMATRGHPATAPTPRPEVVGAAGGPSGLTAEALQALQTHDYVSMTPALARGGAAMLLQAQGGGVVASPLPSVGSVPSKTGSDGHYTPSIVEEEPEKSSSSSSDQRSASVADSRSSVRSERNSERSSGQRSADVAEPPRPRANVEFRPKVTSTVVHRPSSRQQQLGPPIWLNLSDPRTPANVPANSLVAYRHSGRPQELERSRTLEMLGGMLGVVPGETHAQGVLQRLTQLLVLERHVHERVAMAERQAQAAANATARSAAPSRGHHEQPQPEMHSHESGRVRQRGEPSPRPERTCSEPAAWAPRAATIPVPAAFAGTEVAPQIVGVPRAIQGCGTQSFAPPGSKPIKMSVVTISSTRHVKHVTFSDDVTVSCF